MKKLPPNWITWRGYYKEIMRRANKYNEGKIVDKIYDVVIVRIQALLVTIIALPIVAILLVVATITTSYDLAVLSIKKIMEITKSR